MLCHSYDIKVDKHSLMGFCNNQEAKNAKHLESGNIDPEDESGSICYKSELFIIKLAWLPQH